MLRPEAAQDDGELLRRLRGGDEDAFVAFYRRWQGELFRFLLRMSGRPAVAEDVVQEVFMAVVHEVRGYDPRQGVLAAYLYGIARNKLLRRLERERTFVPLEDDGGAPLATTSTAAEDPLAALVREERAGRLWDLVLALPTHYREAVVLCDLQELSYEDAAAALGCAVGTVRSRLHRGRELLSDRLRRAGAVEVAGGPRAVGVNR